MDLGVVVTVLAGLGVVGVVAYQIVVQRRPVRTWIDATETFRDAVSLVETYAPAADQLVAIGQLDQSQRRAYVVDMVLSYLKDVDVQQVIGIVEAWVAENKVGGK